jgi:hypothetical protein
MGAEKTLVDYLDPRTLSVVSLLLTFIIALARRWIVFGYQLDDKKAEMTAALQVAHEERDEWKEMAMRTNGANKDSVREMLNLLKGGKDKDVA